MPNKYADMNVIAAIKAYFGENSRPVTFEELRALSSVERQELAEGIRNL